MLPTVPWSASLLTAAHCAAIPRSFTPLFSVHLSLIRWPATLTQRFAQEQELTFAPFPQRAPYNPKNLFCSSGRIGRVRNTRGGGCPRPLASSFWGAKGLINRRSTIAPLGPSLALTVLRGSPDCSRAKRRVRLRPGQARPRQSYFTPPSPTR